MIQWIEVDRKKCLYSKGWKDIIFAPKQQIESIHLPIKSIQTSGRLNLEEGKYMKIDASQEIYETIQAAQMDVWIDSERVREFDDTTQEVMIRFKHESIHTKSETFLRRFRQEWVDSCEYKTQMKGYQHEQLEVASLGYFNIV